MGPYILYYFSTWTQPFKPGLFLPECVNTLYILIGNSVYLFIVKDLYYLDPSFCRYSKKQNKTKNKAKQKQKTKNYAMLQLKPLGEVHNEYEFWTSIHTMNRLHRKALVRY